MVERENFRGFSLYKTPLRNNSLESFTDWATRFVLVGF